MNEQQQAAVPYFVHEGVMARMERIFRVTVCALIAALAVSVIALVINDSLWRSYCRTLEVRYTAEDSNGVHEQSNP